MGAFAQAFDRTPIFLAVNFATIQYLDSQSQ